MSKWHTPIRFINGELYVWVKQKEKAFGLPVYRLAKPSSKVTILAFPMRGNSKGCIQDMEAPR